MTEALIDSREAARLLKLSEVTVRRHAKAGRLRCVKLGSATRFRPSDVEAFVAASVVAAKGGA